MKFLYRGTVVSLLEGRAINLTTGVTGDAITVKNSSGLYDSFSSEDAIGPYKGLSEGDKVDVYSTGKYSIGFVLAS